MPGIEQFTPEKAAAVTWDRSKLEKLTPYEMATAFWFKRNQDKKDLASDLKIANYTWTETQNKEMQKLLLDKLENFRAKAEAKVVVETKEELSQTNMIYNIMLNAFTVKDNKIVSITKPNISIARNTWDINTSFVTDVTEKNIPLSSEVDGKKQWVIIKYTDPTNNKETMFTISDFADNTFTLHEAKFEGNKLTEAKQALYAAEENWAYALLPEFTVTEYGEKYAQTKKVKEIPTEKQKNNIKLTQIETTPYNPSYEVAEKVEEIDLANLNAIIKDIQLRENGGYILDKTDGKWISTNLYPVKTIWVNKKGTENELLYKWEWKTEQWWKYRSWGLQNIEKDEKTGGKKENYKWIVVRSTEQNQPWTFYIKKIENWQLQVAKISDEYRTITTFAEEKWLINLDDKYLTAMNFRKDDKDDKDLLTNVSLPSIETVAEKTDK